MADARSRMVGESYKDYAARMYGWARAAEVDRDTARAELERLRGIEQAVCGVRITDPDGVEMPCVLPPDGMGGAHDSDCATARDLTSVIDDLESDLATARDSTINLELKAARDEQTSTDPPPPAPPASAGTPTPRPRP